MPVLGHRMLTCLTRGHLAELVVDLAAPWQAEVEGRRHAVRGSVRRRTACAGAKHRLVFDRVDTTLTHLRHELPHAVPTGVRLR
ncbi:hypothetical protein OG462_43345 [Streptomyces sp. NBC_01077]|uniref:hypothetical protein n=1 Tax=Streptomyces sp. NBC_01077 TaxID=2903746 RepID=UPI00386E6C6A|nr:hypothetical protein OG462_01660 [Streptomyces sp. NBC_01077]WSV43611.1 hypothetical protein OG462_43345 [Streptomyces sp. NBC_01077]